MEWPGGRDLAERLEALREQLQNYLGQQNEISQGIAQGTLYDKPEALVYYEQIQLTGQLLYRGGVMDQPYIFMMEYVVCHQFVELFRRLLQQQQQAQEKR